MSARTTERLDQLSRMNTSEIGGPDGRVCPGAIHRARALLEIAENSGLPWVEPDIHARRNGGINICWEGAKNARGVRRNIGAQLEPAPDTRVFLVAYPSTVSTDGPAEANLDDASDEQVRSAWRWFVAGESAP